MIDNRLDYDDAERYRWLKAQGWFDRAIEAYGAIEILDVEDDDPRCYIDLSIDKARGFE